MQENVKTKLDYRSLTRSYDQNMKLKQYNIIYSNVMMGERVLTRNTEELK